MDPNHGREHNRDLGFQPSNPSYRSHQQLFFVAALIVNGWSWIGSITEVALYHINEPNVLAFTIVIDITSSHQTSAMLLMGPYGNIGWTEGH